MACHHCNDMKIDGPKVAKMLGDARFRAQMRRPHRIFTQYDIPYLCGYSWDGTKHFADRHLKTTMPGGFDCMPYLMTHETSEKALLELFGLNYQQAHHIATHLESTAVDHAPNSPGWAAYSAFLRPQIKGADAEKITNPPPDLDLTPYLDEHDSKLLPALLRNNRQGQHQVGDKGYSAGGPVEDEAPDYDYKGAQEAGIQPDERGHMPDTYKLPNHITFSDQSKYHGQNGEEGGKWDQLPEGRWMFTPGASNLRRYSSEQLQNYFQRAEPNSILNLPNAGVTGR